MQLTIQLNDSLATHLQKKANARQISLEEFAIHLLDEAVDETETADEWAPRNRRRLELIRKSCTTGLSTEEQVELQGLQNELDQRLEPIDNLMLERLGQWEKIAATHSSINSQQEIG